MIIKNKKTPAIIAAVLVLLLSSIIYFSLKPNNESRSILIGGSSTVQHYTQALIEEFMKENKGISIYYESGGSTPGLIAVKNSAIDIATMSRDLEIEEDNEYIRNYLIGKDGLGIVVHPSNPLSNLTVEQVQDIFAGTIDNWSSLGGSNSPILVVGRTPDSTTFKGFDEIVLKGAGLTENAVITASAEEMAGAVASNPGAIGFLALKDLNEGVKAVDINGVQMNRVTILTDRYPVSRSFYFVVYDKPDSLAKNTIQDNLISRFTSFFRVDSDKAHQLRTEAVLIFLDFAESAKGQEIIEQQGAVPVH